MATKASLAKPKKRLAANTRQIKTIVLQDLYKLGFKDAKVITHSARHRGQIILYVISKNFEGMSWSKRNDLVWGILEEEISTDSLKRIAYCFVWTPEESVPAFRRRSP